MGNPNVSVVMGTYNAEKVVSRSIRSIQAQTLTNWEFLICDDGSSDGTLGLLQEHAREDPRIRILHHDTNRGLGASLNCCLWEAKAEFCARQDADDWSYPHRLETQLHCFQEESGLALIGSAIHYADENGSEWGIETPPKASSVQDLVRGSCFAHVSVMYRRSAVLAVGGYDERVGRPDDYDLWFRMLSKYPCRNLSEALVQVRRSKGDFARVTYRNRIREAQVRWRGYHRIQAPLWAYIYVLKPLLIGLAPSSWLWRYHATAKRISPKHP